MKCLLLIELSEMVRRCDQGASEVIPVEGELRMFIRRRNPAKEK